MSSPDQDVDERLACATHLEIAAQAIETGEDLDAYKRLGAAMEMLGELNDATTYRGP